MCLDLAVKTRPLEYQSCGTVRVPVARYSVRVPSLRTLTAVLKALIQGPKVEHQRKYQPMNTIRNHFHPTPNLSWPYNLILFSGFLHQNSASTLCLPYVTHMPTHRSTVTSIILSTVTRFNNHVLFRSAGFSQLSVSDTTHNTNHCSIRAWAPHPIVESYQRLVARYQWL